MSLEENLGKLARLLIDAECGHIFVEVEIGEALEDLLERGLAHRVILQLVLLLQLLNQLEQEPD